MITRLLDDNTTLGSNVTDGGNDDTTPTEDGGDATSDDVQSDSEIFGMGTVTVGIIAGAIILLLLSLVLVVAWTRREHRRRQIVPTATDGLCLHHRIACGC